MRKTPSHPSHRRELCLLRVQNHRREHLQEGCRLQAQDHPKVARLRVPCRLQVQSHRQERPRTQGRNHLRDRDPREAKSVGWSVHELAINYGSDGRKPVMPAFFFWGTALQFRRAMPILQDEHLVGAPCLTVLRSQLLHAQSLARSCLALRCHAHRSMRRTLFEVLKRQSQLVQSPSSGLLGGKYTIPMPATWPACGG